ncbi:NAD-dependent epimerase/dehydratase family protein [Pseudomonas guariconensis]|uniref:NAD-dependent epimerase/dehydratase family protein n=1 Tax=Pseudomonas guariconensis TaxID=1288410 RepID=UPI002363474F|nr:NAD-dependent epimerase/dehydratase family protein [Pseudomonas guariconensis]MDD2090897.1 NAD-dependent epimerase/dehydratase family protein [Pseudomonas guariconensis]
MKRVLVTGASGFVGAALTTRLVKSGYSVVGMARHRREGCTAQTFIETDLTCSGVFDDGLVQVDCIVHLAGRAHVLRQSNESQLAVFREVNRDATIRLARAALIAGVKRFVFVSSIGVNGSSTTYDPFRESSTAAPKADYAVSKWEAETELKVLLSDTSMELVIVRPPLIYAADAPGNFRRLLKLVDSGVPLPLQSITNLRSVISRDNAVAFLELCVHHPAAADELFLIADAQAVSTPDMIRAISSGLGKSPRLFPFPLAYLKVALHALGKRAMYEQLCCSLQIDDSKARTVLGWAPLDTTVEGLRRAGLRYRALDNQANDGVD